MAKADVSVEQDNLLSANDVVLVFENTGTSDGSATLNDEWAGQYDSTDDGDSDTSFDRGQLVINDFDISVSKDDSIVSGIGTDEPNGRVSGNKEYNFEFTLQGENANLFDMVIDEKYYLSVKFYTQNYKFTLSGLDYEDFSLSGSSGEAVEFSSSMSALSLTKETY